MEEKENSRGGRKSEIRFDIKQHLGVLSASNRGWNKELNLVSWNGGNAKLDLRAPIATMTMETKRHTNAIYQFFEGMNLGINRRNADNIKKLVTYPTIPTITP